MEEVLQHEKHLFLTGKITLEPHNKENSKQDNIALIIDKSAKHDRKKQPFIKRSPARQLLLSFKHGRE